MVGFRKTDLFKHARLPLGPHTSPPSAPRSLPSSQCRSLVSNKGGREEGRIKWAARRGLPRERGDTHFHIYLREAKTRFYYVVLSTLLTFCCSYCFADEAIYLLAKPLQEAYSPSGPPSTEGGPEGEHADLPCPPRLLSTFNGAGDEDGADHEAAQLLEHDHGGETKRPFRFIFTDLTEVFLTRVRVTLFISSYFLFPTILYQI